MNVDMRKEAEKFAYNLISHCEERYTNDNNISGYLGMFLGVPGYKVEIVNGTGTCYDIIVDMLHKYKEDHPDVPIEDRFNYFVGRLCETSSSMLSVNLGYNFINSEIEKERTPEATFKANNQELLEKLSARVAEMRPKLELEAMNLDEWKNTRASEMNDKYGYKF